MGNLDGRVIFGGIIAIVVVVAAVLGLMMRESGDEEPAESTGGGSASIDTATDDNSTDPGTDETQANQGDEQTPAAQGIPADIKKAQIDVATAFVASYFSYSAADASPNDSIRRSEKLMTPTFFETTMDALAEFDNPDDYDWVQQKQKGIKVTATVDDADYDPWYDPTETTAVIYVDYHQSTQANDGSGGTGPGQFARVEVVNMGSGFLVSNLILEP